MMGFNCIIALVLLPVFTFAQSDLRQYFDRLEEDKDFRYSGIFAEVRVIDSTRHVFSYNGHKAAKPASSLKLISSLLLLEQLGPEYRYQTRIGYTGTVNKKGEL
jgi:serine-type D-Ala-D-Ala carboxypeptidase/endopeptidase (penicillin-binding protein 4)